MKRYINRAHLLAGSSLVAEHAKSASDSSIPVYEIDESALLRVLPPLTDEELAMHWERIETKAAEQRQRYWPALRGEAVIAQADESDDDPTWFEALSTVAALARWALNEAGTHARPHQEAAVRFAESEVRRMRDAQRKRGCASSSTNASSHWRDEAKP